MSVRTGATNDAGALKRAKAEDSSDRWPKGEHRLVVHTSSLRNATSIAPLLLCTLAGADASLVPLAVPSGLVVLPVCVFEQMASINSRTFRHDRVSVLQTINFGIPSKSSHFFGSQISQAVADDKEGWITTAADVLQTLGLAALLGPPFLAGRIQTTLGGYAVVVIALMPPGKWTSRALPHDRSVDPPPGLGLQWRSATEMAGSALALVLSTTALRIRYLSAPSPPLPLLFEVGRFALSKVAFERYDYIQSDFNRALERTERDHAELAEYLSQSDRGDEGYKRFLLKCASTISPVPAADIPASLQGMMYEVDHHRVARLPFEHGTRIHKGPSLLRLPDYPRLTSIPQCDAEIYTDAWLSLVDKALAAIEAWDNGLLARRPPPLYGGLEVLRSDELKRFCAAGGSLDMRGGAGHVIDSRDSLPYPSHWNLDNVDRMLAKSTDRRLRDQWCGGIDLLDDLKYDADSKEWTWKVSFLCGVCPNLLSAYGLEKNTSTKAPAAQEMSDRMAKEFDAFVNNVPQLYTKPIPVRPRTNKAVRFGWMPWCNSPLGQVSKVKPLDGGKVDSKPIATSGDEPIRIIINMTHPAPESGLTTIGGAPVISINSASEIHPPAGCGVPQFEWKHIGEPKPTPMHAACNGAKVHSLARLGNHTSFQFGFDGWKMFHQFHWATRVLGKMGALVPLAKLMPDHTRKLGTAIALVMAMGASPASGECQAALNEIMNEIYRTFDELEAACRHLEHPALLDALRDRARDLPHDDFGRPDRCACFLVYSDDPLQDIAGPPARVERVMFANYSVLGPNGISMRLADESKWLLACHSLWCGVNFAPPLGILWFNKSKRLKAITSINHMLGNAETVENTVKTLSFLEYIVSICHWHVYLIRPLWKCCNPPRASTPAAFVTLNSEERGKLKVLRKRITETPGTSLLRVVDMQAAPSVGGTEWAFQSDARIIPLKTCGLGGANHNVLWQFDIPAQWLDQCTIPLAEFFAHVGGAAIQHEITPDATRIVSEIDASASPHALTSHADSTRLRVAHEEYMLTPLFISLGPVLFCRHLWGVANEAADKASRYLNDLAEGVLRGLGLIPEWRALPNWVADYFERVILRLRSMNLPPLLPGSEYRRFARLPLRNNDPAEAEQVDYQHDVGPIDIASLTSSVPLHTSSLHSRPSTTSGFSTLSASGSAAPAAGASIDIARFASISTTSVPSAYRCTAGVGIDATARRQPHAPRIASTQSAGLDIARLASLAPPTPQEGGAKRLSLSMPSPPRPKRENTRRSPSVRSLLRSVRIPGASPPRPTSNCSFVDMAPALSCSQAIPHRTNRSLMFSAVDVPEGTGHHVPSPLPPQNFSTMFGTTSTSEPVDELTLESLAPLPTTALKHRFEYLMGVAKTRNDSTASEPGLLRRVLHDFLQATHWAAPRTTLNSESSAWDRYWVPYTKALGIDTIRSDMPAHSGADADGFALECAYVAGALPWIMMRMEPAKGSTAPPKPTSGLKVLGHVRRVHLKRYHFPHFVPLTAAVMTCDGLCKRYIEVNGPDALTPNRKEALTNEIIGDIVDLFYTSTKVGRRTIDSNSTAWTSVFAMYHLAAQTGMRKAEMTKAAGDKWTRKEVAMTNVRWLINGTVYDYLTPALADQLTDGRDYCLFTPPLSKADQLGLHWGASTIYLRYSKHDKICAARMLAHLELLRKVKPDKRADTPLFVDFTGAAFGAHAVADMFNKILLLVLPDPLHAKRFSMHSFRIYLACALLEAGASNGTIQTMLRWRSDEALKIYARINDFKYADWLTKASQAKVSNVRTTTLAENMKERGLVEGSNHAAFYDSWLRLAAKATVTASSADRIPLHESADVVLRLHRSQKELLLLAEQEDDK